MHHARVTRCAFVCRVQRCGVFTNAVAMCGHVDLYMYAETLQTKKIFIYDTSLARNIVLPWHLVRNVAKKYATVRTTAVRDKELVLGACLTQPAILMEQTFALTEC